MFQTKLQYNDLLEGLAEVLDITPTQFEEARNSYEAVGNWLSRAESPISTYSPIIYPQGSFRLGTVVKPIADEDNFDVDVVCLLENLPTSISQKDLKHMVGDALQSNSEYQRMLRRNEGRRCWTLQYADSRRFHIDILPSTNDDFEWLVAEGVPRELAQHAIKITDKDCLTYADCTDQHWSKSNPVGYAQWFKSRTLEQLAHEKRLLAEFQGREVETIEDFEVQTPLQRSVQLLKRHRDFMFGDDEDRPISIILTTLAARAYRSEHNLMDALSGILERMPDHVTTALARKQILNPVNPRENFADKWEKHPEREENFYIWLAKAKEDFIEIFNYGGLEKAIENLRESFGERIVNEALRRRDLDEYIEKRSLVRRSFENIFSVSHRASPSWLMSLSGRVTISGRYTLPASKKWHTMISKDLIPKHASLIFTAHTNIDKPYQVYWQVVNTGAEAASVSGGLRGSIFPAKSTGAGGLRHKESTLYEGTHWIQCFIVKNEVCVAKSGEFIVRVDKI